MPLPKRGFFYFPCPAQLNMRMVSLGMWNNTIKKYLLNINSRIQEKLNNYWSNDSFYVRSILEYFYQRWVRFERTTTKIRDFSFDISVVAFVFVVASYVLVPSVANADIENENILPDRKTVQLVISAMQNETKPYGSLPKAKNSKARRNYYIPITAYNSLPEQTDDTPCITASGLDVCKRNIENVVAANFLPIGTRVRIPELYGDRVFYVEDRMNRRYYHRMDIWMKHKTDARAFGLRYANIEVF